MSKDKNVKTKNNESRSSNAGIKIRKTQKNIKVLDKTGNLAERTRETYVKIKNQAEAMIESNDDSASRYAGDRSLEYGEEAAYNTGRGVKKVGEKAKDRIERKIDDHAKRNAENDVDWKPNGKGTRGKTAEGNASIKPRRKPGANENIKVKNKTIKTVNSNAKTIKTTAKSSGKATVKTAKHTVKTAEKSIKTAQKTPKTAIKTAEKSAKVAKKSAQAAAKASQKATVAAQKATVTAARAAQATLRVVVAAAKAAAAAVAKMISAIGAGIVAAAPFIILGLVLVLITTLFTGDTVKNADDDMSNAEIISDINGEWQRQLDFINSEGYEKVVMQGSRASWVDVFSVFTAKAATANSDESKQSDL